MLAGEFVGDVEDLAPVLPDDLRPRVLVAGQAALNRARRWRRVLEKYLPQAVSWRADRTTFFRRTGPRLRAMIAGSLVPATPASTAPATTEPATAAADRDRRRRRDALLRLRRRRRFARPTRARRRARRLPARDPLRAEGQLVARHRAPAQGAGRQRRRQLDGRGRHRAALRVSPGQIMFTGVGKSADELVARHRARAQDDQRRVAGRARSARSAGAGPADHGPGRVARQSGHRRAQPSAHLDRAQDQQVRRADRRARPRSSARFAGGRARARGRAQPHRLADHRLDPLLRAARAAVDLAAALVADGVPLRHVDFGGGVGISYDGAPAIDPAEYARALVEIVRPSGLTASIGARPRAGGPGRSAADAQSSTSSISKVRGSSSCSTPA